MADNYISAHSGLTIDDIVGYVENNKDNITSIPALNNQIIELEN